MHRNNMKRKASHFFKDFSDADVFAMFYEVSTVLLKVLTHFWAILLRVRPETGVSGGLKWRHCSEMG